MPASPDLGGATTGTFVRPAPGHWYIMRRAMTTTWLRLAC